MKKILTPWLCVAIFVVLLINLSSCFFAIDPGPYSGNRDDLYSLVTCNIPGAPGSENATIEVVETDDYGRILFRFSCRSSFYYDAVNSLAGESPVNLRAYMICQKSSAGSVYYMENVCYLTAKSWDEFSDDVLTAFKQANMWNREPNEKNWAVCNIKQTPDYDYPGEDELADVFGTPGENVSLEYDVVSVDAHGKTLIFVRELYSPAMNQFEYYKSYIAISDENGKFSKEYSIEIEDFYNHTQKLITLKELVGWAPITK
ncbi:MAG: hypothetical protein IJW00_02070 [Clostridia bacterium]|nr:hypothetical protein [Clostridia bacterium]